jgi:hypothetical protein
MWRPGKACNDSVPVRRSRNGCSSAGGLEKGCRRVVQSLLEGVQKGVHEREWAKSVRDAQTRQAHQ